MGKSGAPELDKERLAAFKAEQDLKLFALRSRFAEFEELRRSGNLPTSFIAFEGLSALLGARLSGYSDADIRACWPEDWGGGEVTVPAAFLQVLGAAWLTYKEDVPGKTFGEILRLEGGGQGRKRVVSVQKTRDRHHRLGTEVALLYIGIPGNGVKPKIADAIAAIADKHDVSPETVQDAYKMYGWPLVERAQKLGILKEVDPL